MEILNLIFAPFLVTFIIGLLATPAVIKFAKRVKIIDDPKVNLHPKVVHKYPVPRGGGLSIFVALFVSSLIFLPLDMHLAGILAGAVLLTIIGFFDDLYDLNPYLRFLLLFVVAGLPIVSGIGIAFITNPFGSGVINLSSPSISFYLLGSTRSIWLLSDTFALIWIVLMMNILNMGAKGIDGQLPGVVVVSSITIAVLSLKYSADITQWPVIILASIVAGAYLGFLPWNFYPQKIMPGFSGSTLAGYFLAILSILSTTKVGTLLVVVGVPLIDTGYAIIRRLLAGRSPFWGDRGHLHHKLIDLGLSKRQIAYIYWSATGIMGYLAINLNASKKIYTILGASIIILSVFLWSTYRKNNKIND